MIILNIFRFLREYFIIKRSGLFDQEFYLMNNPDVRNADIDPLIHFIKKGWKENRNPSGNFLLENYLVSNPDVRDANINPLVHFVTHGKKEGRLLLANINGNFQKIFIQVLIVPMTS